MRGTLFGVGVGPGDPDLLTFKAARIIETVPTVAYLCNSEGVSRARDTVRSHLSSEHLEIAVEMLFDDRRDKALAAYREAAARIEAELAQGRDVAALCEGDPLLFGSFIHILQAMESDHECRVIPGISSVGAAAAAARKPLVSGSEQMAAIPANAGDDAIIHALEKYDCVAILKPGRRRARLIELIAESGRTDEAVYVVAASQDAEAVVTDLRRLPASPGPYFALFLVSRH